MPPMRVWSLMMHYFRLDGRLAEVWWRAVERSTWSEVVTWRQALVVFEQQPRPLTPQTVEVVWRFLTDVSPPARVLGLLEGLVQEQRLPRPVAAQIEEKVLGRVDRAGRWV